MLKIASLLTQCWFLSYLCGGVAPILCLSGWRNGTPHEAESPVAWFKNCTLPPKTSTSSGKLCAQYGKAPVQTLKQEESKSLKKISHLFPSQFFLAIRRPLPSLLKGGWQKRPRYVFRARLRCGRQRNLVLLVESRQNAPRGRLRPISAVEDTDLIFTSRSRCLCCCGCCSCFSCRGLHCPWQRSFPWRIPVTGERGTLDGHLRVRRPRGMCRSLLTARRCHWSWYPRSGDSFASPTKLRLSPLVLPISVSYS